MQTRLRAIEKNKAKKQPLKVAACNNDAMTNLQNPFRGQQVLTLIGSEQTTSSLVVMISERKYNCKGGDSYAYMKQGEKQKRKIISRENRTNPMIEKPKQEYTGTVI